MQMPGRLSLRGKAKREGMNLNRSAAMILTALMIASTSVVLAQGPHTITITVMRAGKPDGNATVTIIGIAPNPHYEHTLGHTNANGTATWLVFPGEEGQLCFRARTRSAPVMQSQPACVSRPYPSNVRLSIEAHEAPRG